MTECSESTPVAARASCIDHMWPASRVHSRARHRLQLLVGELDAFLLDESHELLGRLGGLCLGLLLVGQVVEFHGVSSSCAFTLSLLILGARGLTSGVLISSRGARTNPRRNDPVTWTVDFDANGTSYHYVVDAETGDLVDFSSFG